jgi:hypothetical protein
VRNTVVLGLLLLWPVAAGACGIASVYTPFDLEKCQQVERPDEYVYEGTWRCKGYGGYDNWQSGVDARSFAGFGKEAGNNCAFLKTFNPFNTALSPIEWRVKDGKPIAAIERWSVKQGDDLPSVTWLVVNALHDGQSCHAHYVAGSYPNANEQARKAADTLAENFDCENDIPTFDSKAGGPPIELNACKDLARE